MPPDRFAAIYDVEESGGQKFLLEVPGKRGRKVVAEAVPPASAAFTLEQGCGSWRDKLASKRVILQYHLYAY